MGEFEGKQQERKGGKKYNTEFKNRPGIIGRDCNWIGTAEQVFSRHMQSIKPPPSSFSFRDALKRRVVKFPLASGCSESNGSWLFVCKMCLRFEKMLKG